MSRAHVQPDPFARISFAGWLKISGPTFAVMLVGFTLVWNSQEAMRGQMLQLHEATVAQISELRDATRVEMSELRESSTAQLLELTRTTGRLEGAMDGMQSAIDALNTSVGELRVEVRRLGERIDALED